MSVDVSVLRKIKQMGLFNPEFYLSHYPVTIARGIDYYDEYYSEYNFPNCIAHPSSYSTLFFFGRPLFFFGAF